MSEKEETKEKIMTRVKCHTFCLEKVVESRRFFYETSEDDLRKIESRLLRLRLFIQNIRSDYKI